MSDIVVMICGPHHPSVYAERSATCPGVHEDTRCYSRIDHAIRVALAYTAPLIVCGDANEGLDVEAFLARARAAHVSDVHAAVWKHGASNTYHDLEMAVRLLHEESSFANVDIFRLVTDPWHMSRAHVMAQAVLQGAFSSDDAPSLIACMVDPCWHPPLDMLERERQGRHAFETVRSVL